MAAKEKAARYLYLHLEEAATEDEEELVEHIQFNNSNNLLLDYCYSYLLMSATLIDEICQQHHQLLLKR